MTIPPGQPFAEILAQMAILNDKLDDLLANGDGVDLRGVTQNWDKKLDSTNGEADGCNSDRFTCLFGDMVVRDNETGLVWDRSPAITGGPDNDGRRAWNGAIRHCADREVGGRKGWQLPMREQLMSLVDTAGTGVDGNGDPVKLSDGHPFQNVSANFHWSATTVQIGPTFAWSMFFVNGGASETLKSLDLRIWCVRGGQSFDGNTHTTLH